MKKTKGHILKKRKRLIEDFIFSKSYTPMREKDIAMLLEVPKGQRKDLIQVLDILQAEGKIEINSKGRYQKVIPGRNKNGKDKDAENKNSKRNNSASHGNAGMENISGGKTSGRERGRSADEENLLTRVVLTNGIVEAFPEKVERQAEACPDVPIEADYYGRMDLRKLQMVTIDGEDAKDLDDAVSLERDGAYWKLGVHIADVSNYVQASSALDREALKRGTSVYLCDRVIPMLPRKLSNGICSLNQGEDRLALSCIMKIDRDGKIVDSKIAETVICVTKRLSYNMVDELFREADRKKGIPLSENMKKSNELSKLQLDKATERELSEKTDDFTDEGTRQASEIKRDYPGLVPMLMNMRRLAKILREKRHARGAIDFDFPEAKFVLNEEDEPVEIYAKYATEATQLIESFMLAANETVAETYQKKGFPFLYRTHETPDRETMEETLSFVRRQGYKVEKRGEEITPAEVQKIIAQAEGSPEENLISTVLLRSMRQARYTTEDIGHFGLAAKHYCHFTSPIRRYPDLQIHRIIKDDLRGRLHDRKLSYYYRILEDVAWKTSALERRAVEVERETNKIKIAEYMQMHLGEEFVATISGVTSWGFYVQLDNTVEGLVGMRDLRDDYYEFDEKEHRIYGRATGRVFTLGMKVAVKASFADPERRIVDFQLAE